MVNGQDRLQKRLLRWAVQHRSATCLKALISQGIDINMTMSSARGDTPLMRAVKHGYLELVEVLLAQDSCRLDKTDRSLLSPLDVAIHSWLTGSTGKEPETKHASGDRYRILRRLLAAGACKISVVDLYDDLTNVLNMNSGKKLLKKLCKLFLSGSNNKSKGVFLAVLCRLKKTSVEVKQLLYSGAAVRVCYHMPMQHLSPNLPAESAILLLRASSDNLVLQFIFNQLLSDTSCLERQWTKYRHVLKLACLLGLRLPLHFIRSLSRRGQNMYKWYICYTSKPPPLKHLARLTVRRYLRPNVLARAGHLSMIPAKLRCYLTFSRQAKPSQV